MLHLYNCGLFKCVRVYYDDVFVCCVKDPDDVPYEVGRKCPYVFFELALCSSLWVIENVEVDV